MDSLQDMIAGYLRSLLGIDADFMMRDLSVLDIDINSFAASNDSMTNMEVIFAVLNRAPQGAVVVIDDVDNYLDDNYADALNEIASIAKNRGIVLFATTRRSDVASVKVQDAAIFRLEPVDGRWSLHSYS
jgi:type IV secretory pathway VirB4 component